MAERTLAENTAQVKADFKGVKDAIFSQVGYDLNGVPTSEYGKKVKDACTEMFTIGKQEGIGEGYGYGLTEGIAQGKEAQYDAMCDTFQNFGKRTNYGYAHYQQAPTEDTFPLKYDMYPTAMQNYTMGTSGGTVNLEKLIEDKGVVFDTGNCTVFDYAFSSSCVTNVPVLDTRSCEKLTALIGWSPKAISVRKIILKDDGSQTFQYFAQTTANLEEIYFEGCIGKNISFQWSTKLKRNPILSILQALNATVSGVTITLPSKCIDTATDTLALIQGDTELNTAYTQALANGYTITFA